MQPLEKVRLAMTNICNDVGHFSTSKKEYPRISWEDIGAKSLRVDNETQGQIFKGYIHLFSKNEDEPLFYLVQTALNKAGISFKYNSVQYEEETGLTHWEWTFEVV